MRHQTACSNCRYRRRKCIALTRGSACQFCRARNVYCTLVSKHIDRPHPSLHIANANLTPETLASPTCQGYSDVPDQDVCNELVGIYFDLIHDKQHILFHRPTFEADQKRGKLPMVLLYSIMALAARFSNNPIFRDVDTHIRGRDWAERSKILFNSRTEPVSLVSLQACMLLHIIAFVEGDMSTQSLYGALAIRMVHILDLPRKLSDDRIQREIEIRVWWTVWSMDNWSAAASSIPRQLHADLEFPRPMEEILFDQLLSGPYTPREPDSEGEDQLRTMGLWSQMIPLTSVIGQIDSLHEITVQRRASQNEIYDIVQRVAASLDSWAFRLPEGLKHTPENLNRYRQHGHGRTFIALHLGFHHHSQLLYYQFLQDHTPSKSPRSALDTMYADRCKMHAAGVTRVLWEGFSTGLQCLWVVNGHLLAVSSSIHIYTLLFDADTGNIEAAKSMLKQNFEMMMTMSRFWPGMDLSMNRLRTFHRQCQDGMRGNFKMDHWMLEFLQKYTRPVSDKSSLPLDLPPEWPPSNILDWQAEVLNTNHFV